jgi:hypothetical protein
MSVDFPIVGLGVSGNAVVVCTTGQPAILTGVSPSSMSEAKLKFEEPCLSRGAILSTDAGVLYPSINGLILVTAQGQVTNTSAGWITKERWAALTPLKNIRAVRQASDYFAYGTTNNGDVSVAQQGYTIELSGVDSSSFTIWPQPGGHRIGFSQLSAPNGVNVDNLMTDPWSGVTLTIQGGAVYYFDFTDPLPLMQPYKWRSKKHQTPHKDNWSAMRVWFDIPPGTPSPPLNRDETPASYSTIPAMSLGSKYGVVRYIADGNYVMERELRYSTELLRLPSGFKDSTWQIEIEAVVSITNIKIAPSVKALANME